MSVKLLTEHHMEFLSLKGGCRGSSESTLVKMPYCWISHAAAQLFFNNMPLDKDILVNTFAAKRDCSRIYRSLPNARLQSKLKGTVDSCLFLTVIRDANLCMEVYANGRYKNVCNVIRFRGNKN